MTGPRKALPAQRGMTLIELLVAMAIGLVVTLAVTSTLIVGESHKRSTTSTNDMNQSGNYAAYVLDRALRSAGSGFTQSWDSGVFGCRLNASLSGATILPRSAAFPAPFAAVLGGAGAVNAGDLRVAPVLIGKSQSDTGSDVLVVMSGSGPAGDVSRPVRAMGTGGAAIELDNTVGLQEADMALMSQEGVEDCLIEQVHAATPFADSPGNTQLPLGGAYYAASGGTATLSALASGGAAYLTPLGNAATGSTQFQLFGVGAGQTLFSYDLLRTVSAGSSDRAQGMADGVVQMRAMYGIDTTGDGILDSWVAPDAAGYDIKTVMTTRATLRQVVAIRVALVVQAANFEKADVADEMPALFTDTASPIPAVPLKGDARRYRHRVVDFSIPLRNVLMLPASVP